MIHKFTLLENFSWLVQQLSAFDDPNITYKDQGMQGVRGGARRIYRYDQHYDAYYKSAVIKKTPPEVPVDFNGTQVLCDKWQVSHPDFTDAKLKEKFPKPITPYNVLVTSKSAIQTKKATRYYVSCTCMDFDTTFKQELINYGYTKNDGSLPAAKGTKKLAPAICKHIYAVLLREYSDVIKAEGAAELSAEISAPLTVSQEEPPASPETLATAKYKASAKAEAQKNIEKTLTFLSNRMSNSVDVYKNSRQSNIAYKKYKFMIKKYPQGFVIVFTNPGMNPFRDKNRDKEIVPILNWERKGMPPLANPSHYYYQFSKDELMRMIKRTKEIQQNQVDKLTKTLQKYTLTESLEIEETNQTSLFMEILNGIG